MKQVKKLLVILPLVALFVLGSLPVAAMTSEDAYDKYKTKDAKITLEIKDQGNYIFDVLGSKLLPKSELEKAFDGDAVNPKKAYPSVKANLIAAIQAQPAAKGWKLDDKTLSDYASTLTGAIVDNVSGTNTNFAPQAFKLEETETSTSDKTTPADPEKPATSSDRQLVVEYYADSACKKPHPTEAKRVYTLKHTFFEDADGKVLTDDFANVRKISTDLGDFVFNQQQNSYAADSESFNNAAQTFLRGGNTATVRLYERDNNRRRVIAYDIHFNEMAFDQISEVELNADYQSTVGIVEAFYNHADIRHNYILVGYVRRGESPVITASIASLERINERVLRNTMSSQYVNAEYAALVVPNTINVPVEHIFPEGTRDRLREIVGVPYETWVTLQNTWRLVDIPSIFRTRIQKVNEEGYTFRSMEYFNGENKITGLVASWDWANYPMGGDRNGGFVARVYYDRAVAAAKEVPSEKKVDAATAPQAQIQAPAAQGPVTAANNATTTTAPANTLPVTGASDSIFLFLSSAALMAVGILFFKKH